MTKENQLGSILIVEDEENLQEALKLNLELEGYEVNCAGDGLEALKKLEGESFDLVIMDIMLPEVDGISAIEKLRLQKNDVPILILSEKRG
jgi:two-component system, OmpR family, alkaline phosphatase synthesis response regulator PhoP